MSLGPAGNGSTDQVRAALRACRLLGSLSPAALDGLVRRCRLRSLAPDEVLFRIGEPCEAMYVVASGGVAARFTSEHGEVADLAVAGAGELIGYLEVIDRAPRRRDAVAVGRATAVVIPDSSAQELLQASPETLRALAADLVRIVWHLWDGAVASMFESATVRLATLLLDLAGEDDRVDLGGPQALLAQRIGIRRQTLNRALHTLAEADLVALHPGGRAVTLDRTRLTAFARARVFDPS